MTLNYGLRFIVRNDAIITTWSSRKVHEIAQHWRKRETIYSRWHDACIAQSKRITVVSFGQSWHRWNDARGRGPSLSTSLTTTNDWTFKTAHYVASSASEILGTVFLSCWFASDDESPFQGCTVFVTDIYRRDASFSYVLCSQMTPHPLWIASNHRNPLAGWQYLEPIKMDRRTMFGIVNPERNVALLASRYWVLFPPTPTCKRSQNSGCRGPSIRDQHLQGDTRRQIENGLIRHNHT